MSGTVLRSAQRVPQRLQSPASMAFVGRPSARHKLAGPVASQSARTAVTTSLSPADAVSEASRDPLASAISTAAAQQQASPFKYGQLIQAASAYVSLVGTAGSLGRTELQERLAGLVGQQGLTYKADGVVYSETRHRTPEEMVDVLVQQHTAYRHKVYRPIALAADPSRGLAFVATYYELDSVGVHMGRLPTDKISRGVLIEELQFEAAPFRLASSLLCRPFTREEAAALEGLPEGTDVVPSKWHNFPDNVGEAQLIGPPLTDPADPQSEVDHMLRTLQNWTMSWNTTADPSLIDQSLAPNVVMLDGYGTNTDKSGRVFSNREEAKKQVLSTHDKLVNTNRLVASAASRERRVAFVHWRANAKDRESGKPVPIEGVGLHVFEDLAVDPRIERILEFTAYQK